MQRWLRCGVLLAVSGGADSVALLRVFVDFFHEKFYGAKNTSPQKTLFAVAHVNHGLRGEESDQDALFVRKLAEKFDLPYFERTIRIEEWDADRSGSFEAAARSLRYDFLLKTAQQIGLRHIATAHTQNDQIETVLHRIIRGTGIAGLAGIPRVRKINEAVSLIRPFLSVSRSEIEAYLTQLGQSFRIDSTNVSSRFTRNRIRRELLPLLKEQYNPSVENALANLAQIAAEAQEQFDIESEQLWNLTKISRSANEVLLKRSPLLLQSPFRIREFFAFVWKTQNWPLQKMGFAQFVAIEKMIRRSEQRQISKQFLPGNVEILVDQEKETVRIILKTSTN